MSEPIDAFGPLTIDEQLADNPQADTYVNELAALVVARGCNPSWKRVREGLAERGVVITENPIKRVVGERVSALR